MFKRQFRYESQSLSTPDMLDKIGKNDSVKINAEIDISKCP